MSVSITAIDRVDLSSFISKLKSGPLTQDQIYFEYCNLINEYPFVQQLLRKQPSRLLFTKLIQQEALITDDLARIQREFLSFLSFVELKISSDGSSETGAEKKSSYIRNLDTGGIQNENHAQSAVKLIQSQKTLRRQFIHELVHGGLFNHVAESEKTKIEELIKKEADIYPNQKVSSLARRFLQEQHPTWIMGENELKINSILRALETRESGVFGRITSQARSPEYLEVVKQNQEFFNGFDPYLAQTKHYKAIEHGLKLLEEDLTRPVEERKINNPEIFVGMLIAIAQSDPYVEVADAPTFSKKPPIVSDEGADQTPRASNNPVVERALRYSNALSLSQATSVDEVVGGRVLVTMLEASINDYYKSQKKDVPDSAAAIIKSFNAALEDPSGKGTIPGGSITFAEAQRRVLQGAFINLEADQEALIGLLGEEFVKSKIYQEMVAKTKQDYVGKHFEGAPSQANKRLDLEKVKDVSFFQSMFKSKAEAEKALGVPIPDELWGLKIPSAVAISQVKAFKAMLSLGIDHPDFPKTFGDYIKSLPGYKEGAPINTNALVIFKFLELDAVSLSPENQYLWYVFLNDPKNVEVQELLKLHGIQELTKALPTGEKGFSKMDKVHAANLAYMAVTHPDAAFMFALSLGAQIVVKKIFSYAIKAIGKTVLKTAFMTTIRSAITVAMQGLIPIPIVGAAIGWVVTALVEKVVAKTAKNVIKISATILLILVGLAVMGFNIISINPQSVGRALLSEEVGKNRAKPGGGDTTTNCIENPTLPECELKECVGKCAWPLDEGIGACIVTGPGAGTHAGSNLSAIDFITIDTPDQRTLWGKNVYTPYDGVVISAFFGMRDDDFTSGVSPGNYGNQVHIRADNGAVFVFGHLRKIQVVQVGQRVRAKQTIGFVDHTGLSKGTHLHYERKNGDINEYLPFPVPKCLYYNGVDGCNTMLKAMGHNACI